MPIFYPTQWFGRFGLSLAVTYQLVHSRYGVDMGERYHKDIRFRIETSTEIDRMVYEDFHSIELGYREPFPRCSIEPFGHRFLPALYGSQLCYASGEEPAALRRDFRPEDLDLLEPWTLQRFTAAEPVREVVAQTQYALAHYDADAPHSRLEYNPLYLPFSSLQNLGSVINTAVSVYGEDVLMLYASEPQLLRRFYANILELILLCLRYFPQVDRRRLEHVFVGNCYVAMISPRHYRECNEEFDRRILEFARGIGAEFLMHQDSDVTAHLPNYARLGQIQALDFGQDTDFEQLHRLFPDCRVNCILFPAWLQFHPIEELREELERIMRIGARFPRFTFSILEIDPALGAGKIFEIVELFRACADGVTRHEAAKA
jgi:hypothetical protein